MRALSTRAAQVRNGLADCSHWLSVVIYRPPTIWETRQARRETLVNQANKLKASHPHGWPYYAVVRGSAECNLPLVSDTRWANLSGIPILILCHGEDEVHPISSGIALTKLLPHARLEVAANESCANIEFPHIVSTWLRGVLEQQGC